MINHTYGVGALPQLFNDHRMKARIVRLASIALLGSTLSVVLHLLAPDSLLVGDFARKYLVESIKERRQWPLTGSRHYIAGIDAHQYVYVAGPHDTGLVCIDLDDVSLPIQSVPVPVQSVSSRFAVESGALYTSDLKTFSIHKSALVPPITVLPGSRILDSTFFLDAIPISDDEVVIRAINSKHQHELSKISLTQSPPALFASLLQKDEESVFDADGIIVFNRPIKTLVYVYYYRNEFIILDSMLRKTVAGKTIDGIQYSQIRVGKTDAGRSIDMASLPRVVNRKCQTSGNWIFIQSAVRGRNEARQPFRRSDVIDIYDISDGRYAGSFFIPKVQGDKLRDFRVDGDKLIAIHGKHLTHFDLSQLTKKLRDQRR